MFNSGTYTPEGLKDLCMPFHRDSTTSHLTRYDVNQDDGSNRTVQTRLSAAVFVEGQTNARWRSAIKAGQIVLGPYTRTSFNVESVKPFNAVVLSNSGSLTQPQYSSGAVRGDLFRLPSSPGIGAPARTKALTRAYKGLSAQQTHANGMQFLGELHEVIAQFKRPYSSAVKLVDTFLERAASAVRRYRPRSRHDSWKQATKNLNKALADSWLETAFGLQPLIADVKDLAEAAARMSNDKRRDVVFASATSQVSGSTQTFVNTFSGTNIGLNSFVREVETSQSGFRVFCDWSRSASLGSLERCAELVGFRADKFIPTIYELIPYSFLVDYWSNLGDVIETGCQAQSMVKGVIETLRNQVTSTQLWVPYATNVSRVVETDLTPGSASITRKYFLRTGGFGALPTVPFQLEVPGTPMKYVNMLALYASRASKIQNDWFSAPHRDKF